MDSIYGSPIPDSQITPEVNLGKPALPAPYNDFFSDPIHQVLDNLEMSTVQQGPFPAIYEDPLSITLGKVEDAIVKNAPLLNHVPMELDDILSELESQIENQTIPAPKPAPEMPSSDVLFEQEKLHKVPNGKSRSSAVPTGMTREESSPTHQYHGPIRRMTGQNTGIRNIGSELVLYCNVHREWISKDKCDDCPDFEETDYVAEEEKGERCKHSFSNISDYNSKEENGISGSEDVENMT